MTTPANSELDRITVLLVTYQSAHCASALGQSLAAFPNIIVIDNASSDNTLEAFAKSMPRAKVIANERNLGFGAANNRGVLAAETEFVLLLNPDCIIDASAAQQLLQCADANPSASMMAPQLIDRHGNPDKNYSMGHNTWPAKGPLADGNTCVGFVSGACMLIRRDAMLKIKGFDERFFLYYEDTDLCLRLTEQCGEIILAPQSRVTHLSRGSSGGKARFNAEYLRGYHHIQSKFLFDLKHHQVSVSHIKRWRYCLVAGLELCIRLLLLDAVRASRVLGRVVGAWRYPDDMKSRQVSF